MKRRCNEENMQRREDTMKRKCSEERCNEYNVKERKDAMKRRCKEEMMQ